MRRRSRTTCWRSRVCYGLCVQGVGKGTLATNLLPEEIFQDRLIREKKPWAVAAVASVLVGCALGFAGHWRAWASVQVDEPEYKACDCEDRADVRRRRQAPWTAIPRPRQNKKTSRRRERIWRASPSGG